VEQVVTELPIVDVSQDAGQSRVAGVVDRRSCAVLQEIPDNVEHVPLVPRLVVVLISVPTLLECITNDQDMEWGVAQRVGLIDKLP
jgi:hypothetical protein